jgi:hypothetical protein
MRLIYTALSQCASGKAGHSACFNRRNEKLWRGELDSRPVDLGWRKLINIVINI